MKSSFSTSYPPQRKAASSLVRSGRRDNALQHGLILPHRAVDAGLLRTGRVAAKDRS